MIYPDNYIAKDASEMDELDREVRASHPLAAGWLPVETYHMVQMGYPMPHYGGMVHSIDGGTNELRELLPPSGMWCKAEDVKALLFYIPADILNEAAKAMQGVPK